jgi:hypothetical protein
VRVDVVQDRVCVVLLPSCEHNNLIH